MQRRISICIGSLMKHQLKHQMKHSASPLLDEEHDAVRCWEPKACFLLLRVSVEDIQHIGISKTSTAEELCSLRYLPLDLDITGHSKRMHVYKPTRARVWEPFERKHNTLRMPNILYSLNARL